MPELTGKYRDVTPSTRGGTRFGKPGTLPDPIRGFHSELPKLVTGLPREFVQRRSSYDFQAFRDDKRAQLEARAVSLEEVYGSVHERIFYRELLKRQIPFDFQSSLIGPRRVGGQYELGTIVPDFILLDRRVIVSVEGGIWHRGVYAEARDVLQQGVMAEAGWTPYVVRDHQIEDERLLDEWFRRWIEVPLAPPPTAEMLARIGVGVELHLPTRLGVPYPVAT